MKDSDVKRRDFLKYAGICSTGLVLGAPDTFANSRENQKLPDAYQTIYKAVYQTPIVDAHEHLYDEKERLGGISMMSQKCNDWTILLNHYLNNDMGVSGMSDDDYEKFFSPDVNPNEKWKYLSPVWQQTKFTGYAQAVRLTRNACCGQALYKCLCDMCWSWIINPVSAKEFLKKFIVTVPYNKLIVFGGDYRIAESTVGHAILTRNGIIQALNELVNEGFLSQDDALGLVEPLLRGNCHEIYNLKGKTNLLKDVDWSKV